MESLTPSLPALIISRQAERALIRTAMNQAALQTGLPRAIRRGLARMAAGHYWRQMLHIPTLPQTAQRLVDAFSRVPA